MYEVEPVIGKIRFENGRVVCPEEIEYDLLNFWSSTLGAIKYLHDNDDYEPVNIAAFQRDTQVGRRLDKAARYSFADPRFILRSFRAASVAEPILTNPSLTSPENKYPNLSNEAHGSGNVDRYNDFLNSLQEDEVLAVVPPNHPYIEGRPVVEITRRVDTWTRHPSGLFHPNNVFYQAKRSEK